MFYFAAIIPAFAQKPVKADPKPSAGVVDPPQDYPWQKNDAKAKKAFRHAHIREADVMWSKRVWRTIDLREKINHPLYFPITPTNDRKSLFDVIKAGINTGKLTIYDNPVFDDEFRVPLFAETAQAKLMEIETLRIEQLDGSFVDKIDTSEISSDRIKQYWIKEDWFINKQTGVMEVRIIGICPLKENIDPSTGAVRGYQPMFWLYFPELRTHLSKTEAYVRKNISDRMSFDELFEKRFFGSYIHKESNVYDRSISEYKTGLDALLEAENVKDQTSFMEHDMWQF